jgi:hypothetical protein
MAKVFTLLLIAIGWGLGESLGPRYYPTNPETWLFIKAISAGTLAGFYWFIVEAGRYGSTP